MAKKALVLGITTYPPPAVSLKGATREAIGWESRLEDLYGFDVTRPTDEKAITRPNVLQWLRELLGGAKAGDHLCFVFCGHGTRSLGWQDDTTHSTKDESALVLHAASGSNGFADYTIAPSDLVRIVKATKPPVGARFTSIIDACFSGGFGGGDLRRAFEERFGADDGRAFDHPFINPVSLFIPDTAEHARTRSAHRSESVMSFLDLADLVRVHDDSEPIVTPLVLAASPKDADAFEVGPDNDRHLLFSACAFDALELAMRGGAMLSSKELIEGINALEHLQQATYYPHDAVADEPFLGGWKKGATPGVTAAATVLPATTKTESEVSRAAFVDAMPGHTADTDAPISEEGSTMEPATALAEPAGYLYIRVVGLATLFDGSEHPSEFPSRVVLPYDDYASNEWMRHRSFLEVPNASLKCKPSADPNDRYTRAGVIYSRWNLTEHLLQITNVQGDAQPVTRSAAYIDQVPGLVAVTGQQPPPTLRPECFLRYPRPGLFNAFLDLQNGSVDLAEVEDNDTIFRKEAAGTTTWGPRKTPLSVIYTIPLTSDHAAIIVSSIQTRYAIYVKSGTTVIVGNVREEDINGRGSGETPREHFRIYFNLLTQQPTDPGLPEVASIPINACTVTNYP